MAAIAIATVVLAATIVVAIHGARRDASQPRPPGRVAIVGVGAQAPEIDLQTLDHHAFRLSKLRGTPTILTFGASWCHPCREEYPRLERIRMQTPTLAIVGVSEDDIPGPMATFMREVGATFPVAWDAHGVAAARFGVDGLPVTLFIDTRGIITGRETGLVSQHDLDQRVAAITRPVTEAKSQ